MELAKNAWDHVSTCDTWSQVTGSSLSKKRSWILRFGILKMWYPKGWKVRGIVYRWPRYFGLKLELGNFDPPLPQIMIYGQTEKNEYGSDKK